MLITRFSGEVPDQLARLVEESKQQGLEFLRRLVTEWERDANRFAAPGEALFGAWQGSRLVGVCGLNIDPYQDDPRVARLRHLYVLEAERRQGVGAALVRLVLAHATGAGFVRVRLRTVSADAGLFYETQGFAPVAGEEAVTHARVL